MDTDKIDSDTAMTINVAGTVLTQTSKDFEELSFEEGCVLFVAKQINNE